MNLREMRKKFAGLLAAARVILDAAEEEDRGLTDEEQAEYDRLMGEADGLEERIQRAEVLENRMSGLGERAGGQAPARPDPEIGLTAEDLAGYSLLRAIRAAAANDWREAGFEREVSIAVAERVGRDPRGFFVPAEWQRASLVPPERRDMSVGVPAAGGYTVATDLMAASFIDLLRNRMVVRAAGATVLGDLVGDVDIPKHTGASTMYWLGEGEDATESTPTLGQVGLKPKTAGGYVDLTRRLLKQSSLDMEAFVRSDLATTIALGIDLAALHGDGAGNEPLGIINVSGIGDVAGGTNGLAPAWSHVVELETDVSVANADIGSLAYITNAKVRGKLKQVETASGSGIFVWNTDTAARPGAGWLNGYPAYVSNQVSSTLDKGTSTGVCSAIFFGNWADLVIAMWGVLDVLVDPYTLSKSGGVRVVAFQDIDIGLRHAGSFSVMKDALTA